MPSICNVSNTGESVRLLLKALQLKRDHDGHEVVPGPGSFVADEKVRWSQSSSIFVICIPLRSRFRSGSFVDMEELC